MDLQGKIEARKREREKETAIRRELALREAAEQAKKDEERRKHDLIEAVEQAKRKEGHKDKNLRGAVEILAQKVDGHHSEPEEGAGLNQIGSEGEPILTAEEADKILEEEALNRIGPFTKLSALGLIGFGIYAMFSISWLGLFWVLGGLGLVAFRMHVEKQNLLRSR